ncbi:dTMP kinase [Nanoarchaeota archaeon]|nr:MAG: dTMP kinase [Nanoarchaeota archaeon]
MLIAIEGIDGSGKTTQAKMLVKWLKRAGYKAKLTHEPTKMCTGKTIYKVLHGKLKMSKTQLDIVYTTDRLMHYFYEIAPYLKKGYVIVSDRYKYSGIAYGCAKGNRKFINELEKNVPEPDLTIYLRIDPRSSTSRLKKKDAYEKDIKFLTKVSKEFDRLRRRKNMITIDGKKPIDEIHREIISIVAKKLGKHVK